MHKKLIIKFVDSKFKNTYLKKFKNILSKLGGVCMWKLALSNIRAVRKGLALPRAKLLMWFIYKDKLNIKSRLRKLHIITANDAFCPLFNEEGDHSTPIPAL